MSGYVTSDLLSTQNQSAQELTPGSIIRGSAYTESLFSASPLPEFESAEVVLPENFGVIRGIAWSLVFEGTAAAVCFAIWQAWKLMR